MSDAIETGARRTLTVAAIFGGVAVAIGAFGAHTFKPYLLEIGRFDTFETAVRYQFYHTFALIFVGLLQLKYDSKLLNWAGNSFFAGILFFCGSLYTLCLAPQLTYLGMVAPIGGLLFITGWLLTAISLNKK